MQGGLEIPIKVAVTWAKVEKLSILAAKFEEIEYPITEDYTDDFHDILAELGVITGRLSLSKKKMTMVALN